MKKHSFNNLFTEKILKEVRQTRDAGQKEYAHTEDNVFANFERVASFTKTTREKALLTYMIKHIDGLCAYADGHRSQREDVTGRIKDAIVYLCLLWGMAEDKQSDIDAFFDEHGFTPSKTPNGSTFNPETGEVSYQSLGDEAV